LPLGDDQAQLRKNAQTCLEAINEKFWSASLLILQYEILSLPLSFTQASMKQVV
jgi:hypothetical protein